MKKFFLLLALMPLVAFSQDIIYTHTGDQIHCKITNVTDTIIYLEQTTAGVTTPKYIQRTAVANFRQNCKEPDTLRLPSQYLKRAGNFQMASYLMAGVGAGSALLIKDGPGKILASTLGVLSIVFQLCGIAQLQYAGDALKRIEVNSNGLIIKF